MATIMGSREEEATVVEEARGGLFSSVWHSSVTSLPLSLSEAKIISKGGGSGKPFVALSLWDLINGTFEIMASSSSALDSIRTSSTVCLRSPFVLAPRSSSRDISSVSGRSRDEDALPILLRWPLPSMASSLEDDDDDDDDDTSSRSDNGISVTNLDRVRFDASRRTLDLTYSSLSPNGRGFGFAAVASLPSESSTSSLVFSSIRDATFLPLPRPFSFFSPITTSFFFFFHFGRILVIASSLTLALRLASSATKCAFFRASVDAFINDSMESKTLMGEYDDFSRLRVSTFSRSSFWTSSDGIDDASATPTSKERASVHVSIPVPFPPFPSFIFFQIRTRIVSAAAMASKTGATSASE